jgi:hypothetical protein
MESRLAAFRAAAALKGPARAQSSAALAGAGVAGRGVASGGAVYGVLTGGRG